MTLVDTFLVKINKTGQASRESKKYRDRGRNWRPNRTKDGSETGRKNHQKTGGGIKRSRGLAHLPEMPLCLSTPYL